MNKQKTVAKLYKQKQIESATPMQLVLLLYQGAIDYLNKAEGNLLEEKTECLEQFHQNLVSCQNVITELSVALDMEKGGEIAEKLFQLYDYMNYRLAEANISKKIEGVREVRQLLADLKVSWEKVAEEESSMEVKPAENIGLNIKG
jgi:flagellar protein FliS